MDDIFVATSGDQGTRLKPGPDMLVEAIEAWGSGENERSVIVTMVGDPSRICRQRKQLV